MTIHSVEIPWIGGVLGAPLGTRTVQWQTLFLYGTGERSIAAAKIVEDLENDGWWLRHITAVPGDRDGGGVVIWRAIRFLGVEGKALPIPISMILER